MNPLHIANNPAGLSLIADLRGLGHSVKLRGRNPNRKQFYPESNRIATWAGGSTWCRKSRFQQDLPLKLATHFAVYTDPKGLDVLEALINLTQKKGINVLPL
jgi:hypothetical protein